MASHEIEMYLPKTQVVKTDVEFVIRENNKILGRLFISKGNIEWVPNNHRTTKYSHKWSEFADWMKATGRVMYL
jgi:hypothetical protein